ncbi:4'-phosphopantetheinyl transferase superfamily protein [Streptomyces xanthophaeus]|uniref:4'-phosphopantetheinyl transferase family protein n=1 Tax=Streptomyces xanthophaeus TaxID=67385 RepID=UPI00386ED03C|nr:4'-phosphopantetheinyl transferase superfamily protein [Streptomyces xanthophaeus]WST63673.1 4'-phosphopantetheinyl transferase superfamily protein [Streptomyces xanthophaeus]
MKRSPAAGGLLAPALPRPYRPGAVPGRWRDGGPQLWLVDSRGPAAPAAGSEAVLDPSERARADAYRLEAHRRIYVATHVALRLLLGSYLEQDPAALRLVRERCPGCGGPHGRPAAAGSPVHFSVSHSAGVALLAFAGNPVGVDLEKPPTQEALGHLAPSLHVRERAELDALAPEERPTAFAACWTRKEAYLKGTGLGLARGLHLDYVGIGACAASPPGWTLTGVTAPPGFAAACAVRHRTP